jgi:hypothetical protein
MFPAFLNPSLSSFYLLQSFPVSLSFFSPSTSIFLNNPNKIINYIKNEKNEKDENNQLIIKIYDNRIMFKNNDTELYFEFEKIEEIIKDDIIFIKFKYTKKLTFPFTTKYDFFGSFLINIIDDNNILFKNNDVSFTLQLYEFS